MCGIAGGISFNGSYFPPIESIEAFAAPLKFRGPDAEAIRQFSTEEALVNFAHKRLKIIDLSDEGNQPMESSTSSSVIVFNGEIYNYKELRNELTKRGCQFNTNTDTEVLLMGFETWGISQLLEKIDGMFAFALFCKISQKLILARDRFGKKPLYYYSRNGQLAFSSDIRSFDEIRIEKTIDQHAIGYFFYELSTPSTHTVWQEIQKVPEAHFLTFSASNLEIQKYWHLDYTQSCALSNQEIVEHVDELLGSATKKRMVADVNVAAQLSGGIDSSLIVAKMAQNSAVPIRTYSVGFEDKAFNELPFAKQVAIQYQTDHTELIMKPNDLSVINSLIDECGEPFADASVIPTYLIAQEISNSEKVVCGGDGGDELFAGYYQHYSAYQRERVAGLKPISSLVNLASKIIPTYRTKFLADLLQKAHLPDSHSLDRQMSFSYAEMCQLIPDDNISSNSLLKEHSNIWKMHSNENNGLFLNTLSSSFHTRLVNDYLVKVDRGSMFASLEVRSPFLDRRLAEFAATLKPNQLYGEGGTKSILKKLAEKHLPHDLIHRKKMGFSIPLGEWFRTTLYDDLKSVVLGGKQSLITMNYDFIEKLIERHKNGENLEYHLWTLYTFHRWAQKYS